MTNESNKYRVQGVNDKMAFIIRELYEKDFEQVSRISQTEYVKRVGSFSLVSNIMDSRMLRKFVVIDGKKQVAGYGLLWEQNTSPKLILKLEMLFRHEYRDASVVDTLLDKLSNHIQKINPIAVQARTFDDQTHLLHCYKNHGFIENHRMVHAYLTAADAELTSHLEVENSLRSQGIMITTLAKEQIGDIDFFDKLQTLNKITWSDYPSEPLLPPSSPSDVWLTHKDNIPDAYFVAKMGEAYIGHSHLMKLGSSSKDLIQGLTATLREFRGKGVATALKLKGIEYAKRNGYNGIYTSYRNYNKSMKSVNEKLGWQPYYNEVRLEKYVHI